MNKSTQIGIAEIRNYHGINTYISEKQRNSILVVDKGGYAQFVHAYVGNITLYIHRSAQKNYFASRAN
jgi:regulator of RNase E activity RraA